MANRKSKIQNRKSKKGNIAGGIEVTQEITERKQAEEALRQSEQRLSLHVQQTPLAVIEWNLDFEVVAWNPAAEAIFGYSKEEALGRHIVGLIVPEEIKEAVGQVMNDLFRQKGGSRNTNENITKDGRIITCEWYNTPLIDGDGQVIGVTSLALDITERVQLEQQTQESLERRVRQVETSTEVAQEIATAPVLDELFRRVVNLVQERFGYYHAHVYALEESPSSLVGEDQAGGPTLVMQEGTGKAGRQMKANGHTIDLTAEKSLVARAAREGEAILVPDVTQEPDWLPNPLLPETKAEIAVPIKLRDEVLGVLDVQSDTAKGLTEEDQILLVGLCGQIAVAVHDRRTEIERQQAEDALRLTQLSVDQASDSIFWIGPDARLLFVNEGACQKLGYTREELLTKMLYDLDPNFPPEVWPGHWQELKQRGSMIVETEHQTKDGHLFPVEVRINYLEFNGQEYNFASARDITERKRMEEALAKRISELNCLNETGREIAETPPIPDLLQWVTERIPSAMLYPDLCQVAIKYDDQIYGQAEAVEQPCQIVHALRVSGQVVGRVYIAYTEKRDFLDEESAMLGGIAIRLGGYIENRHLFEQTQQRTAQLEEATNFLDSIIENIPNGIFVKDAQDLKFVEWNKTSQAMFGLKKEEVIGKSDHDFFPKEEADFFATKDRQVLSEGKLVDISEEPIHTADKGLRYLHTTKVPIFSADGQPKYLLGISEDVTERKQTEEAVIKRTRELSCLNDIGREMEEMPPVPELLQWVTERIPPAMQYPDLCQVAIEFDDQVYGIPEAVELPCQIVHGLYIGGAIMGRVYIAYTEKQEFMDEESALLGGIATRVSGYIENRRLFEQTQQRAAELEESRSFLDSVIESIPNGIFVKDAKDLRFVGWNKANEQITGLKRQDVLGKNDYDFFPPEEADSFTTNDREALAGGELVDIPEEPIHTADKGLRFLHTSKVPILGADGQPRYLLGISEDITERKQVEELLAKRATELEAVAEVGTAVSSILEPHKLLQAVVDLTKSRFSLYHAHIYLLDEAGETLNLVAGAGEVGRQMVAEGWRIPLAREQSLVARAARSRQGVIVNDVREDPDFLPNPLLPDTRSEMAVPMIAGDKVLGVLDVQADEIDHFTDEDVRIEMTLASQVAVALQNAHLYEQTQVALTGQERLAVELDSERRMLQTVLESIPFGVFVAEVPTGKPLLANKRAEEILGRGISPEAQAEELADVYAVYRYGSDEPYPQDQMPLVRGMFGETTVVDDMEIRRPDGQNILVQVSGAPIKDASGQVTASVAIFGDITEQKQAEIEREQLLAEVQRLAAIVENHPDFIGVGSLEGQALYVNPSGLKMMGLPPDHDVTGMEADDFYPAEDAQKLVKEGVPAALKKGFWSTEANLLRVDGTTIPIEQMVGINYDAQGQPYSFSITMHDITNRKLAAEALQASEKRFALAVEGSAEGIWDWDIVNNTLYWSPRLKQLVGYADDELDIDFDTFASFLHSDDAVSTQAALDAHLKEGVPYDIEQRMRHKSGEYRWFRVRGQAIWDETGQPLRMAGSTADITGRKQAEAERERLLAEVEATYRQFVRREWEQFLGEQHQGGLHIEHQQADLAAGPASIDPDGHRPGSNGADEQSQIENPKSKIDVPIALRGEAIGTLRLEDLDPARKWTAEEKALVETVSEQLALTVENLRLFEDTQQTAVREQLTRQITDKMRAAPDVESIINTGLTELARALGVSRTYVKLTSKLEQSEESKK